ncbi:MAG: four-carbon acid sugar kinase family protein, partial [Solirubrobacterales bacterium]|nr:four-carbon acid sugar kinase family protein [Solirubrobacterales bacterium]
LDLAAVAAGGAERDHEVDRACRMAVQALASAPGVVMHSSLGAVHDGPVPPVAVLGEALARVVVACRVHAGIERVVIAGGDTSGYVTRALGVEALEAVGPVRGQALLCRVTAGDLVVSGLELVLKGGQIGRDDLFETARTGAGP